jgi:hypothetical protein
VLYIYKLPSTIVVTSKEENRTPPWVLPRFLLLSLGWNLTGNPGATDQGYLEFPDIFNKFKVCKSVHLHAFK